MTLSKERLEEIARVSGEFLAEEERTNGKADLQVWLDEVWPGVALEMARELLERRERDKQKPVGYAYFSDVELMLRNRMVGDMLTVRKIGECPLYTTPPAPVVPDNWTWEQAKAFIQANEVAFPVEAAVKAVNAYRAAMLKGNKEQDKIVGWVQTDSNGYAPLFIIGSDDPSEVWGVKYAPLKLATPKQETN